MSVTVRIPAPLRSFTSGQAEVKIEAETVGDALYKLDAQYHGFREKVLDEHGNVRRFINVFVNEDNIRDQSELATKIRSGDTISILPSIAGGRSHSRFTIFDL